MRPTVLLRLLVFSGSLTLHVQSGKVKICGTGQYTVTNGSLSYCLKCDTCHTGYGLYPVCGQTIAHPPSKIGCKRCSNETFSAELDSGPCHNCHQCEEHEIVAASCTRSSDRICNGTCEKGYFFAQKVPHTCQQCSYCCFDGKDEEQAECIKQGLNATGRYCSVRPDKQCSPLLSSTVTMQGTSGTHLPSTTHSPVNLTLASHPTDHHIGDPAIIVSSVLSGLFLAAVVVAAMLYMCKKKKQIWRRKRTDSVVPGIGSTAVPPTGRSPAQGNYDNTHNTTEVPQVVFCATYPRVEALQNTGYDSSPSATPKVSPFTTPQQTDDEVEELPDVIAERNKRRVKRRNSKEPQTNVLKKDGANESLLDPNEQATDEGQDIKGAGQSRPRRHSLEAFKRKFSLPLEKDAYQLLSGEDPDELQGNDEVEPKSRSGSILSYKALKRKFSVPEILQEYSSVKGEDPDRDRSREPIKIEVEPIHQRQKEGSRVEFKCNVQGNKKVLYQWVKDGIEMQGQNSSSLVLSCVVMRDFGCYACHVSDPNADCTKSPTAVLDVAPLDGMDYKCLTQIDDKTQSNVETLLTKKIHGLGGWKQVAIKYGMDEVNRDSLEGSQDAGKTTIGYVKATHPDLTVYEFCKTLKESNIRRFDIIKELLGHLSVLSSEKTT